jgi:hypothetical protein
VFREAADVSMTWGVSRESSWRVERVMADIPADESASYKTRKKKKKKKTRRWRGQKMDAETRCVNRQMLSHKAPSL